MLNALRQSAQGLFAKIILLLLVASFVLWGIADIFKNGGGAGSVATVDKTPISIQQYQQSLRQRQDQVREMMGAAYKPEMMSKLGIEGQVVVNLINHLITLKEAGHLGITVSDDDVRAAIAVTPAFMDDSGHFSKTAYQTVLRNHNIPEQRFVQDIRKDIATKFLVETIQNGVVVPDALMKALYIARHEARAASLLLLPPEAAGAIAAPSDKELQAYYDTHKQAYITPEVRSFSYIVIKADDVQSKIQVPEEDLKALYAERQQDFHQPERRDIEQMLLAKEQDAKKAEAMIAKGSTFIQAANAVPVLNKGKLELGEVAKKELPAAAQEPVFALKDGAVSAPFQDDFGWHIFHVLKHLPEGSLPLEAVRADLTRELAARDMDAALTKQVRIFEDTLAGGGSFEEAAAKVGQKSTAVGFITHEGLSADGKKYNWPDYDNFLGTVFSTNEKEYSQGIQAKDGSYFFVRVDGVTPEHAKPLEEVKSKVAASWTDEKKNLQLQKAGEAIDAELRSGKNSADVMHARGLKATFVPAGLFTRDSQQVKQGALDGTPLPADLVAELFHLKLSGVTHAYAVSTGQIAIATLTQIAPEPSFDPKADTEETKALKNDLRQSLTEEAFHDYLLALRAKYPVTVNEKALGIQQSDGGDE